MILMAIAYTLVKVEPGKEREVFQAIKGIRGVQEVAIISGEYDIFVKFDVESPIELAKSVLDSLRKISGLKSTVTYKAVTLS
jgi:DNA-binding Lrp family transcriptional regulator